MARAFSLTSDGLAYFIGYTLIHAPRTIIVSPWLSNVELRFPVNEHLDDRRMRLLDALAELPDRDVTFVVREGEDQHNDFVRDRLPEGTTMHAVEDLHAKVVVCDEYAYLGSANITRNGLTLNREICEIVENEFTDAESFVEANLDVRLPWEEGE